MTNDHIKTRRSASGPDSCRCLVSDSEQLRSCEVRENCLNDIISNEQHLEAGLIFTGRSVCWDVKHRLFYFENKFSSVPSSHSLMALSLLLVSGESSVCPPHQAGA